MEFVDRHRLDEPRRALALVVALALALRLFGLGVRVAHWDEGRVGYWILRTAASGHWEYRPIIHGPFVQHVTRWVIGVAGASDFAMRLPVAVLGGLAPLTALLFRTRLRDAETIALGLVLAVNPLLVYYSRFMRSDLPLAVFAFLALGAIVAAFDRDDRRYLHLAAIAAALALTTKENAILYPVSWLGAGTLVVGAIVVARGRRQTNPWTPLRDRTRSVVARLTRWRRTLAVLPLEGLVVIVFFYAPRSPATDRGLSSVIGDPTQLGTIAHAATVGSGRKVIGLWLDPQMHAHAYVPYLAHFLVVLALAAAATVLLAVLGVRWRARPLVTFCGWWGLSAVVGYPYAADVKAPWLGVHAVIALAIPAAVGVVAVVDRYRDARMDGRQAAAVGLAILLVGSGAFVVGSLGATSFHQPPDGLNVVAQGGQPGGDLRPILDDIETVARTNDGPDVLYYGDLAVREERYNDHPPVLNRWYDRLPLPWYTERSNATVTSASSLEALPADPPPVVIAEGEAREELAPALEGYTVREEAILIRPGPRTISVFGFEYHLGGKTFAFFVDREAISDGA